MSPMQSLKQPDFKSMQQAVSSNDAIFQRMILIIPYRSSEKVRFIETTFEQINLQGLNLENTRYLNTKELTEADRANRELDFLGGFELIDKEMRMYVLEGLGGMGQAMD